MRLAAFVAALLLAGGAAATAAVPAGTFHGCPHGVRPLAGGVRAGGRRVRRSRTSTTSRHASTGRPAGTSAPASWTCALVRHWFPSGWVKEECGRTVWLRSALVSVYFPVLDKPHNPVGHCNACSHLAYLVSLTARGWTVWGSY